MKPTVKSICSVLCPNGMLPCLALFVSTTLLQQSCTNGNSASSTPVFNISAPAGNEVYDYWHQGKAEITGYKLNQARYGEMRDGEAVLIFVSEDLSKSKHVKLDDPSKFKADAVNVLKMNMTKKFDTGIYPYSMMLSVFTPFFTDKISYSLKATASSQEWCGHTFTQLNLQNESYLAMLHSYFESEGEQKNVVPKVVPEDELWTMIRIAPDKIPQGEMKLLPGLLSQRLRHSEMKPENAVVKIISSGADENTLSKFDSKEKLKALTVNYPEQERTLSIYFTEKFPHRIAGWEETYMDGFGANKKKLTTLAVKKKTLFIDYWNHNKLSDDTLRDSLK